VRQISKICLFAGFIQFDAVGELAEPDPSNVLKAFQRLIFTSYLNSIVYDYI